MTAHPRVCGENPKLKGTQFSEAGSSPRVRGKQAEEKEREAGNRLIPACAGKTRGRRIPHSHARAHPRVCGENSDGFLVGDSEQGSSPRVRGKLLASLARVQNARLIPACAGKTLDRLPGRDRTAAHPRVCGENFLMPVKTLLIVGSSPRVRGKPATKSAYVLLLGLIPACAGKTSWEAQSRPQQRAHPRVCGENCVVFVFVILGTGSSPRVRGKPVFTDMEQLNSRLIPACAGKTTYLVLVQFFRAAHPRVCGENLLNNISKPAASGSSPRVRGKPYHVYPREGA